MSSATKPLLNSNNLDQIRTVAYETTEIPRDLWPRMHSVYMADQEAAIVNNPERLDDINTNLSSWRDGILNPNSRVGKKGGLRDGQIFGRSIVALSFKTYKQANSNVILDELVDEVIIAENASGHVRLPRVLWTAEAKLKMALGKDWLNIRGLYQQPGAQEALDVSDDVDVVSAITLTGLWYAIMRFGGVDPNKGISGWRYRGDPLDKRFYDVTRYLEMEQRGPGAANTQDGFLKETSNKEHVTSTVGKTTKIISSVL